MNRSTFSISTLFLSTLLLGLLLSGCEPQSKGNNEVGSGKTYGGQVLPVINKGPLPDFSFMNQDSQMVTPTTIENKVHVMDFFFTSCPTICPRMKTNMLTVYDEFKENDNVVLVSHSIDTRHDSVPVLKEYSEGLEVGAPRWHFVTGEKIDIMDMARDYMVTAIEDSLEPGGYAHSGALILFDKGHNIRGYYDGTSPKETGWMIKDMKKLLDE